MCSSVARFKIITILAALTIKIYHMLKTVVTGNLGRDAEIKTTEDGRQYATFSLANTEKRNGQPVTTWFQCFIHREPLFNALAPYLKKGTKVLIEGRQYSEIWTKQDQTQAIAHSLNVFTIELMGSSTALDPGQMAAANPSGTPSGPAEDITKEDDDDLPF